MTGEEVASRYHLASVDPDGANSQSRVVSLVPPNSTVLEVGCATGAISAALEARGCRVTALEVDPRAAAVASSRVSEVRIANVEVDDLATVVGDTVFDAIVVADVLEHLVDPSSTLRRLSPWLKVDGRVVFSVPNVAHASVRLALWEGRFEYSPTGLLDATHLRMFTRATLSSVMSDAGLAITHLERVLQPVDNGVSCNRSVVPGPVLDDMLRSDEATTYQFVGLAVRDRAVSQGVRHAAIPQHTDPLLAAQASEIASQIAVIQSLRSELETLMASRTYRVARRMAEIIRRRRST